MTTTPPALPKAALAILALPGVESLEREADGWCCHLRFGWTSDALGGGGTIIDPNLKTVRAYVMGAYELPPVTPAPELPGSASPRWSGPVLPGEPSTRPVASRRPPTLPGETLPPLPYRQTRSGHVVAWDEPGETF
jgi:hypothetical protein